MNLRERIDAFASLQDGWGGQNTYAVNRETRELAKSFVLLLNQIADCTWEVGPMIDGSLVFRATNDSIAIAITVAALDNNQETTIEQKATRKKGFPNIHSN